MAQWGFLLGKSGEDIRRRGRAPVLYCSTVYHTYTHRPYCVWAVMTSSGNCSDIYGPEIGRYLNSVVSPRGTALGACMSEVRSHQTRCRIVIVLSDAQPEVLQSAKSPHREKPALSRPPAALDEINLILDFFRSLLQSRSTVRASPARIQYSYKNLMV